MSILKSRAGIVALRKYVLGLCLVVAGAGLMDATGSVLPLAMTGSAALMLTVPLVKHLATRKRRRERRAALQDSPGDQGASR